MYFLSRYYNLHVFTNGIKTKPRPVLKYYNIDKAIFLITKNFPKLNQSTFFKYIVKFRDLENKSYIMQGLYLFTSNL